jgi:hypothetical protein
MTKASSDLRQSLLRFRGGCIVLRALRSVAREERSAQDCDAKSRRGGGLYGLRKCSFLRLTSVKVVVNVRSAQM